MKTFADTCAQGDVIFIRRAALPADLVPVVATGGELIVTHSETGHHHVMVLDRCADGPPAELFSDKNNPLIAWLKVNRPTALEHRRPFDTREAISFAPGIYEVRRQREYIAEGWRRVED